MKINRHKKFYVAAILVMPLVVTLLGPARAHAISVNYNNLMSDPVFDDYNSMSSSQIDSFLNSFPSSCISTKNGFSAVDPTGYNPTQGFLYGSAVSAGKVIYDAAQAYEINPEVLLATLQKEESLVVGDSGCSLLRYTSAVGYGCPDGGAYYSYSNLSPALYYINGSPVRSVSGTCVDTSSKAGFTQQIIRAAWLLKFDRERSEGKVSWAIIKGNWDNSDDLDTYYSGYMTQGTWQRCSSCAATYYDGYATIDSTAVHMDSGATASFYVYTPHLSGNSNFVTIFSTWFGSTNGSILFKISGSSTYYLEWAGYYYPIPSGYILNVYGLASIAPRTISVFPSDETRGPALSDAAKFGSDNPSDPDYTATVDLVEGGMRHDAPNWSTISSFGVTGYTVYPASLSWVLSQGDALRPVVRQPNGAIFLIQNNKKRGFPDWQTFSTLSGPNYAGTNQVYSQQDLTNMSTYYLDTKDDGAPMLLDGKFIGLTDSPAIYLYDSGKKYMFSPSSYAAWGGRTDYKFTSYVANQITDGGAAPILVGSSGGTKYLVDNGKKKSFSSSTETAWGLVDSQFTQVTDQALARLGSGSVSTLVTPGAGVYYVTNGQRDGIASLSDFGNLGFSWANVDHTSGAALALVPQGPTLYAPGALLRTPNGAVYVVNSNYGDFGVTSGTLFSRFGFSWGNVRNVSSTALNGYSEVSLQTLLKSSSDGSYYEVDNGVRHYVDSTAYGAGEYNMSGWSFSTVDPGVLGAINSGPALTQFIRGSGPTVYYVQNGQIHGITSEAEFTSLGGTWAKVVSVSDQFLSEIPRGAAM